VQDNSKSYSLKDVVEMHQIGNTEIIGLLISYLVDINSEIFSISSFEKSLRGKGIKVSKKTISQYIKYLEEVFFVFAIEKFSYSGRVRIQNPKKVYLGDNIFYTMLFNYINKEQGKAVGIISNAGVQKKRL
jgi:predicted AAA+ superfamily ATPase